MMGLGEEYDKGEVPLSLQIRESMIAQDSYGDVNLDHLLREVSARFLHCEVCIGPFPLFT